METYETLIVFPILKFAIFRNYKIWGIFRIYQNKNFGIFQIGNFRNFPNLTFSTLEIFGIVKINKFLDFFQFVKPKFSNFKIVHRFNVPHYSIFCQFSYFPIDINQLSQFLYFILVTRKFSHFTSKRSLIFKFETSAILKFYCLKF